MHHVVETQGVKTELFSRPIIFTLMYLACSKSVRVQREKRNFKGTKRNVAYYLRDFVFSLLFDLLLVHKRTEAHLTHLLAYFGGRSSEQYKACTKTCGFVKLQDKLFQAQVLFLLSNHGVVLIEFNIH